MKIQITLGGQARNLWFNNYAKGALGGIYGLDPMEATEKLLDDIKANYVKAIENMVSAGLEGYHEATDTEKDYTRKDIKAWVADATDEDMVMVFNTWLSVSEVRNLIPTVADEPAKKKRLGRKS